MQTPGLPVRAYRDAMAALAHIDVRTATRYFTAPERLRAAQRLACERAVAVLGEPPRYSEPVRFVAPDGVLP